MRYLFFFKLLLVSCSVVATEQIPDVLIYKEKEMELYSTPLDTFLDRKEVWNKFRKQLKEKRCTADWNGYIGKWKIEGEKLYLMSLHAGACDENPREIPLKALFGKNNKVFSSWYTGDLVVPAGEVLENKFVGFAPPI